jgi:GAF domain-containing protein
MAELRGHDLAVRMAELARSIAPPRALEQVLAEVTASAVELIAGADTAGVLLIAKNGKFESLVGTSELVNRLDDLQAKYHEGPCVGVTANELIVRTDDFATEQRWPNYSPAIVEMGVRSGLSFKLFTSGRTAGALNLFGLQPNAFTSES